MDFPIKHAGSFHSFVPVDQRVMVHVSFAWPRSSLQKNQGLAQLPGYAAPPVGPGLELRQMFVALNVPVTQLDVSLAISRGCFHWDIMEISLRGYPLVDWYKTMERSRFFMGKSTISTGPFSIANC